MSPGSKTTTNRVLGYMGCYVSDVKLREIMYDNAHSMAALVPLAAARFS